MYIYVYIYIYIYFYFWTSPFARGSFTPPKSEPARVEPLDLPESTVPYPVVNNSGIVV